MLVYKYPLLHTLAYPFIHRAGEGEGGGSGGGRIEFHFLIRLADVSESMRAGSDELFPNTVINSYLKVRRKGVLRSEEKWGRKLSRK